MEPVAGLGDRVEDRVTHQTGIVVAVAQYLFGVDRVLIQPESPDSNGRPIDSFWVDGPQARVMVQGAVTA